MEIYIKWDASGLSGRVQAERHERIAFGKAARTTVLLLVGWLLTTVLGSHAEPVVRALLGM